MFCFKIQTHVQLIQLRWCLPLICLKMLLQLHLKEWETLLCHCWRAFRSVKAIAQQALVSPLFLSMPTRVITSVSQNSKKKTCWSKQSREYHWKDPLANVILGQPWDLLQEMSSNGFVKVSSQEKLPYFLPTVHLRMIWLSTQLYWSWVPWISLQWLLPSVKCQMWNVPFQ